MNRITAAALAAFVLAVSAPAAAQAPRAASPAHLSVTGEGRVDRTPDRVTVSLAIVTNDDQAARATSANNAAYNALVAKLRGLGIETAAIRTTGFDVSFNPRPAQPNTQFAQRYGYVATRNVAVASDRTEQAGAIIDAGVAAGVTDVGGVSFGVRDERAASRAAQAAAVADADAQAQALAAAAHVRIVRIVSLAAGVGPVLPRPLPAARMTASAAQVPTDVQPGSLTVSASVSIVYEVAP